MRLDPAKATLAILPVLLVSAPVSAQARGAGSPLPAVATTGPCAEHSREYLFRKLADSNHGSDHGWNDNDPPDSGEKNGHHKGNHTHREHKGRGHGHDDSPGV